MFVKKYNSGCGFLPFTYNSYHNLPVARKLLVQVSKFISILTSKNQSIAGYNFDIVIDTDKFL